MSERRGVGREHPVGAARALRLNKRMADDRLEYVSLHTLHTDVATPSLRDVGSDELTPCNLVPAVEGVRPLATMLGV